MSGPDYTDNAVLRELCEFLKENLRIRGSFSSGGGNYGYDSASLDIELLLCGEVISSETVSM